MRRSAVLVVLALLAACSHDDPSTVVTPSTSTSAAAGPTSTVAGGAPAPQPQVSARPGQTVTTAAPAEVPSAPQTTSGPPGSAAPLYLRPRPATSLVLAISSNAGTGPTRATVDHVEQVLRDVSGKPVSIAAGPAVPTRDAWTAADLRAAVPSERSGDAGVLHLLFLHGRWADDDSVLGISVRADLAAIFTDQVDASASPIIGSESIQVAVTTHEVGHLLGLVDLYLDTGRDDPQHPGHSTDRASVMYWAVESSLVTDLLTGGPPRDFDAADKADLATIRGGA
jgi:hypothetical protein